MRLAIVASTLTIVSSRRTSASGFVWLRLHSQGESAQTDRGPAIVLRQLPGTTTVPLAAGVADDEYECAIEIQDGSGECPQCTMSRKCACVGAVRFGYSPHWTDWLQVKWYVDCSVHVFGDLFPGHGKLCMCRPSLSDGDGLHTLGGPAGEEQDGWTLACVLAVALT